MNNAIAAVLWPDKKLMSLESVVIEDPRDDEVLVKVVASGVCHTDMVMRDGGVPTPQPVVLGHEGAGIIEKVGQHVQGLAPGDHVTMSFSTCGECPCCSQGHPAYCHQFFPLNFFGARADGSTSMSKNDKAIHSHIFGQSSFATYALCHQRNVVKIDPSMPLELVAPFGCGLQTGAGAILNSLKVESGSSVMVLGSGTVGMAAMMAARIAGADHVVAVDVHASRLDLAKEIGATLTVNSKTDNLEDIVKAHFEHGLDYILDTTAYIPVITRAIPLLAPRGTLGLAAAYKPGEQLAFEVMPFMSTGLNIRGIVEGDSDIKTFIPELIGYYQQGKFPVDRIIEYFKFDDINSAIDASEKGTVVKAVVLMQGS